MKTSKLLLYSAVSATITLLVTSCSNDSFSESSSNNPTEVGDTLITLKIGTPFQTSIEPFKVPTRSALSLSDVSTVNRLDLWLTSGEDVIEIHQTSSDASYGFPTLTIDKNKTYRLTAIAHKGSAFASLSDNIIAFPDEKLTDTFVYSADFTKASETNITLYRIVGMFKLWITDQLPSTDTQLKFTISGTGNKWNSVTSSSENQTTRNVFFKSPSQSSDGSTKLNIYILPN